jgi:hypothetical protein
VKTRGHRPPPIAPLAGVGHDAAPGGPALSAFCDAFGVTVPFSEEKLAELYPRHASFAWQYFFASPEVDVAPSRPRG